MKNSIYTFPSGLKMGHFENKNIRSVAIGVTFGVGSGNEIQKNNGISHFIEHMMFKGTDTRSAMDIVSELEDNGINVNAFTSKLTTCYYTISIDEEVEKCFEVLSDILLHSTFSEEEMKREKGVILEEISISEDDPQDLCLDMLSEAYFGDHPLGRPILGSRENVSNFTRDEVLNYFRTNYVANNCCIAVTGNISFEVAKALVEKYFEGKMPVNPSREWKDIAHETAQKYVYKYKDVEQANLGIIFKSLPISKHKELVVEMISSILGGGMSSRLFQTIREKMGLAYSVYTYQTNYVNNSYFAISLSTNVDSLKSAIKATRVELDMLIDESVTEVEFNRAKKLTKSGFIIGAERNSAIMRSIAKSCLIRDKEFDLDAEIAVLDAITIDDVKNCIREIFNYDNMSISYVGREIDFNPLEEFLN